MKRFFIFIILFLTFELNAIEKGKWTFVVDGNFCYIGSAPIKEEGNYTKRGEGEEKPKAHDEKELHRWRDEREEN